MATKRLLRPERRRRIPQHFSWLDHRLVRERHIERLTPEACALYLFLLTVADAQGLSYYADPSIARRLSLDEPRLRAARTCLLNAELIAFEPPLYQVLELPPATASASPITATRHAAGLRSIAEVIRQIAEHRR
jgi:hypothetical protein